MKPSGGGGPQIVGHYPLPCMFASAQPLSRPEPAWPPTSDCCVFETLRDGDGCSEALRAAQFSRPLGIGMDNRCDTNLPSADGGRGSRGFPVQKGPDIRSLSTRQQVATARLALNEIQHNSIKTPTASSRCPDRCQHTRAHTGHANWQGHTAGLAHDRRFVCKTATHQRPCSSLSRHLVPDWLVGGPSRRRC